MSYRVMITATAKQDLRDIALYITEQSKESETAKRFVMELREKCATLSDFPNAGALPRDRMLLSLSYRYVKHKDYLIFYTVNEEEKVVNVMAVFNCKKDYTRPFLKMI